MTAIEILKAGRALIADPARWVQRYYARTADGYLCPPNHPNAVCWCPDGALEKVAPAWIDRMGAVLVLNEECGAGGMIQFNDRHSHAEVIAAWDRAIAKLEASDGH